MFGHVNNLNTYGPKRSQIVKKFGHLCHYNEIFISVISKALFINQTSYKWSCANLLRSFLNHFKHSQFPPCTAVSEIIDLSTNWHNQIFIFRLNWNYLCLLIFMFKLRVHFFPFVCSFNHFGDAWLRMQISSRLSLT